MPKASKKPSVKSASTRTSRSGAAAAKAAKSAPERAIRISMAYLYDKLGDDAAQLQETASLVDKAAKRGIIHKNAANRRKSRLAKRMNAAKEGAAAG